MRSQEQLHDITNRIVAFSKDTFSENLNDVILYGSYARGDFDEESDIDVIVLIDMDKEQLRHYWHAVDNFANDLCLEFEIMVSLCTEDVNFFHEWRDDMPFYRNVWNEGVKLIA